MYVETWLFWTAIIVIVVVVSIVVVDLKHRIFELRIGQQKLEEKLVKYVKKQISEK